jgi:bifunctional non-homologous end joining protein LigD
VLVPLGRGCTYEQSRWLAQLLGAVITSEHPDLATLVRPVAARGSRVYIDCLQNGHGKLLVAPFSARPLPGAPVSAPLAWSEVNARLTLGRYTIHTMPARLRRQRADPWAGLLEVKPQLEAALERLAARVDVGDSLR